MKKLIIAFGLFACSSLIFADSLNVTVETKSYGGYYAPKHCYAMWVTNSANKWVKNLEVNASFEYFALYLTNWLKSSGQNAAAHTNLDCITSASLNVHRAHTLTWDCKDANKAVVPDGIYTINVEFTEDNATGIMKTYTFNKSPITQNQVFPNATNFINAKLNFTSTALDTTKPKLINASCNKDSGKIVLLFSEALNKISAETIINYSISNAKNISSAILGSDLKTVTLILSTPLIKGSSYIITVNNIKDAYITPNTILQNTQRNIEFLNIPVVLGLVGYWGFNENTGTIINDASEKGNHGNITNATWQVSGKSRTALGFNGSNSNVNLGKNSSLDISGAVTISAWINPKVNNVAMSIMGAPTQYNLSLDATNRLRLDDTKTGFVLSSPNLIKPNEWTHVVGIFSGANGTTMSLANARLYVNGDSVAIQASGNWSATTPLASNVLIGGSATSAFNGSIDEVAIYNRSLAKNDILGLSKMFAGASILPTTNTIITPNSLDISINSLGKITFKSNLFKSPNLLFEIYDISGKNIWSCEQLNNTEFTWNNSLPNGMYFVSLKDKNVSLSKKFIVMR